MSRILGFILFAVISVYAVQVTPLSVTASTTFSTYNSINLINDSGMSGGLHDTDWQHMWLSDFGAIPAALTFDLGDSYDLTSVDMWQYTSNNGVDRSVQDFDIYVSDDNVTFTYVTSATLAIATTADLPAQTTAFTATGRYVRLILNSNYGSSYIGLAEVKFNGDISSTVSVPLSVSSKIALILLLAVGAFSAMRLRARA